MTPQAAYPHELPPIGKTADYAANLRAQLPVLETERLILRAPIIEDFAQYREICLSDRAKYMVEEPFDREDAWLDFTQCVGNWLLRGHGLWTITQKDTGKVLGFTLICMEFGDREPELGWFLTEEAEGHGYAFEATQAARDHGVTEMELSSLVSYVDSGNTRSIKLAERLDAKRDATAEHLIDEDVFVYRHHPQIADHDGGIEAYA